MTTPLSPDDIPLDRFSECRKSKRTRGCRYLMGETSSGYAIGRTQILDPSILEDILDEAQAVGFDADRVVHIWGVANIAPRAQDLYRFHLLPGADRDAGDG